MILYIASIIHSLFNGQIVLIEGFFDVISAHQAGVENPIVTLKNAYEVKVLNVINSDYSNQFNPLNLDTMLWNAGDEDGRNCNRDWTVAEQTYTGE